MAQEVLGKDQFIRETVNFLLSFIILLAVIYLFAKTTRCYGLSVATLFWSFIGINLGTVHIARTDHKNWKQLTNEGKTAQAKLVWESTGSGHQTSYAPYVHLLNTKYPSEWRFYLDNSSLQVTETPNDSIIDVKYVDGKIEPKTVSQVKDIPATFDYDVYIVVWIMGMMMWGVMLWAYLR